MSRKKKLSNIGQLHVAYASLLFAVGVIIGLIVVLSQLVSQKDSVTHLGSFASSSAAAMRVVDVRQVPARELFGGQVPDEETGLVVTVSVENKTDQDQSFLPVNQMYLKDATGTIYKLRPVAGIESPIKAGIVKPGEAIQGDVSFIVESSAEDLWLNFDNRWDDSLPIASTLRVS